MTHKAWLGIKWDYNTTTEFSTFCLTHVWLFQEARRRYDRERQSKAKMRQEQIEQEEKRQREIYLNGGFVDCVNAGCEGQVRPFCRFLESHTTKLKNTG